MRQTIIPYLAEQASLHPAMLPQDAVKLCYQAAFGAGHLLADPVAARRRLEAELAETPPLEIPLYEPLSDAFARCNLAAWKQRALPLAPLFQSFSQAALAPSPEREALFLQYIEALGACVRQRMFRFDAIAWNQYLQAYREEGTHAVHHSALYRACEHPAYRVISRRFPPPIT